MLVLKGILNIFEIQYCIVTYPVTKLSNNSKLLSPKVN